MATLQFDSLRLRWRIRPSDRGFHVTIKGCADIAASAAIRKLEKELRDYTEIIFDVTELAFADSTFFRFLVRLQSRQRDVRLVGVGRHLQKILEVTGLARIFPYETVA